MEKTTSMVIKSFTRRHSMKKIKAPRVTFTTKIKVKKKGDENVRESNDDLQVEGKVR